MMPRLSPIQGSQLTFILLALLVLFAVSLSIIEVVQSSQLRKPSRRQHQEQQKQQQQHQETKRVIIQCKPEVTKEECRNELGPDIETLYVLDSLHSIVIRGSVNQINKIMQQQDDNEYSPFGSSNNKKRTIAAVEDDPPRFFQTQPIERIARRLQLDTLDEHQSIPYGINMIDVPKIWESYDVQGEGIKICIIDTGVDASHLDISMNRWSGWSFRDSVSWYHDDVGHGTHVGGILAAVDNDFGVVGIAPKVEIVMVRMFDDNGEFFASDLVDAAFRCENEGAHLINLSVAGPSPKGAEFRAFQQLRSRGIIPIAAAGNSNEDTIYYPAGYTSVLSVSAIDTNSKLGSFATINEHVDFVAPGVNVLSLLPRSDEGNDPCLLCDPIFYNLHGYGLLNGTSMAAPHVTGTAALLWSAYPDVSAENIIEAMTQTTKDVRDDNDDVEYAMSLIQSYEAMKYLENKYMTSPTMMNPTSHCENDHDHYLYVELSLFTDSYGDETSWEIVHNNTGRVDYKGSDYSNRVQETFRGCLPADCYTFTIYDKYGDGLCCEYGRGTFSLMVDTEEILFGSSFGNQRSITFGTCDSEPASTTENEEDEDEDDSTPTLYKLPVSSPSPTEAPKPTNNLGSSIPTIAPMNVPTLSPSTMPTIQDTTPPSSIPFDHVNRFDSSDDHGGSSDDYSISDNDKIYGMPDHPPQTINNNIRSRTSREKTAISLLAILSTILLFSLFYIHYHGISRSSSDDDEDAASVATVSTTLSDEAEYEKNETTDDTSSDNSASTSS